MLDSVMVRLLHKADYAALRPQAHDYAPPEHQDAKGIHNLMRWSHPAAIVEKTCFDRRLLVVIYGDDIAERDILHQNDRIKRALGKTATAVWHSRDMFAFAFNDPRYPADIMPTLRRQMSTRTVYDAGIFKIADVAPEVGAPSPLELLLAGHRSGVLAQAKTGRGKT